MTDKKTLLKYCNKIQARNINAYFDAGCKVNKAAAILGVNKSVISRSLSRAKKRASIAKFLSGTPAKVSKVSKGLKILVIPDTQVKFGDPMDHLTACGNYIVEKKPDVIVHIGDHYDMKALSSFDTAKQLEGKRVLIDLEAGYKGMDLLMKPLIDYNLANPKNQYHPRLEFCLGNHEVRLERYINTNPTLSGILEYPREFRLESWGWNVNEFKKPIMINGFAFAHYFYNPMSGRPYGGTAHTKLNKVKCSFVMGHQQGLDLATTTGNDCKRYWGITAGSFYQHDEGYIGPQANDHWRGLVMMHNVLDGDCAPCIINIDWLLDNYSNEAIGA